MRKRNLHKTNPMMLLSPPPKPPITTETPQLSLRSLTGLSNYNTMRVSSMRERNSFKFYWIVEVLITWVVNMRKLQPYQWLVVEDINYRPLYICVKFKWTLQQKDVFSNIFNLRIGCWNLTRGIQWLKSLGPNYGILINSKCSSQLRGRNLC